MQPQQHPAPGRIDALVGEWEMQDAEGGQSMVRGRVAFEWLEGGALLVQRADAEYTEDATAEWVENSPFPVTSIIGPDDRPRASGWPVIEIAERLELGDRLRGHLQRGSANGYGLVNVSRSDSNPG
jgi:hypothetical protein